VYRYVVKLPDIFDCQGQKFIFRNFVLPQFLERYGVKVIAVSVTGAVLLPLWTDSVSGLLKSAFY